MGRPLADLHDHVRQHGPELVKFGIVGGLGTIIDLGGAAVLHSVYHLGPLESKALSITAATIFTYLGSRFWTFRHRENQPVHREALLFVALNVAGLVLAELVIAVTTYGLGLKGPLAYNAASFIGTALGTVFRWYAYRKWVFLAPAQQPLPQPRAATAHPDFPHYAPWELDPAYLDPAYSGRPGRRPRPVLLHSQNRVIPNGRAVAPLLTAPVPAGYSVRPAAAGPVPAVPAGSGGPNAPRAPGRHRKR
ncbi:MAG: GtrA family protein [Trebonia sp.]